MVNSITTDNKEIRLAVVSDIHLGNKRTKTEFVIANLDKYLSNDTFLSSIDLLFIAGDVYDELLNAASDEVAMIDQWIGRLLRKCHRYGVTVRVLAGTPSHDRGQSRRFETINELNHRSGKRMAKLRYVDVLEIEYLQEYDMHVLYVPDEWSNSTQDTLDQVRALLAKKQLKSVDIAIMHGNFQYQLPAGIGHIPMHDEEAYSEIVSRLIFIGHIHVTSCYGKIYAQGSFDRSAHNEEEAKGFMKAVLSKDAYTVQFIENKDAARYLTIRCENSDVATCLMEIAEQVSDVKPGANMRIDAHFSNPIHSNLSVVKERWPEYQWTSVVRGTIKKIHEQLIDHKAIYVPVVLDRLTLHTAMADRLTQRGYTSTVVQDCSNQLLQITGG